MADTFSGGSSDDFLRSTNPVPPNGGLGFAESPTGTPGATPDSLAPTAPPGAPAPPERGIVPPAAAPTPTAPTAAPQEPPGSEVKAPQFSEDPIGAIGFILRSVAAGFEGRELPSDQLKKQQLAAQEMTLRRMSAAQKALSFAVTTAKSAAPGEKRDRVVASISKQFGGLFGGEDAAKELIESSINTPGSDQIIALAGNEQVAGILGRMFGGDTEKMFEFASKPENRKVLEGIADRDNLPIIGQKVAQLTPIIKGILERDKSGRIEKDSNGNIIVTMADLERVSRIAGPKIGFSDAELDTIRRNKEAQGMLLQAGIDTPDITALRKKEEITQKDPEFVKLQATRRAIQSQLETAEGTEATRLRRELKEIDAQIAKKNEGKAQSDKDGVLFRRIQANTKLMRTKLAEGNAEGAAELQASIDNDQRTLAKSQAIVGKTPTDKEADAEAREGGKENARRNRRVKPVVARLLGESPDLTIGEAQDRKISADLTDKQVASLNSQESAAKGAMTIAARIFNVLAEQGDSALSAAGGIAKLTNDLKGTVKGLAEVLTDIEVGGKKSTFQELRAEMDKTLGAKLEAAGFKNAEMRSLVIDMAFAVARGREGGRLTDQDVSRALETLGANNASAEGFSRVLTSFISRVDDNFKIEAGSILGADPISLLDQFREKIMKKKPEDMTLGEIRMLTDEQLKQISGK